MNQNQNEVRLYLNEVLPPRWLDRCTKIDVVLHAWPPNSPDLTPCVYFL